MTLLTALALAPAVWGVKSEKQIVDEALKQNPKLADKGSNATLEIEYARELIKKIAPIARDQNVSFEKSGTNALVNWVTAEQVSAEIRKNRPPDSYVQKSLEKVAKEIVKEAVPNPTGEGRVITDETIQKLQQKVQAKGLCPCWPFC